MQARHSPHLWQPWRALGCWYLGMGPCLQMQPSYPQVPSFCELVHTPKLLWPKLLVQPAGTHTSTKEGLQGELLGEGEAEVDQGNQFACTPSAAWQSLG